MKQKGSHARSLYYQTTLQEANINRVRAGKLARCQWWRKHNYASCHFCNLLTKLYKNIYKDIQ